LVAIVKGGGRGKRNAYSLDLELLKELKAARRKRSSRHRLPSLNIPPAEALKSVLSFPSNGGMTLPSPAASGRVDGGMVSREEGIPAEAMSANQQMRLHVKETAFLIRAAVRDDFPIEFWGTFATFRKPDPGQN
jgi:hypothetical protein